MNPKRFYLQRIEDESGISGIGRVADGVQFEDGQCIIRWRVWYKTTSIFNNIEEVNKIHGHDGKTKIVWID